MAETFNPNGYSAAQIAKALEYASDDHDAVQRYAEQLQLLAGMIGECKGDTQQLQNDVINLLKQIIYKGSANKLHLETATITVPSVAGLSADLSHGVIKFRKTDITADDVTIVLEGAALEAGEYYLSVGDTLDSSDDVIGMYIYDDNDEFLTFATNTDDVGVGHTLSLSSAITHGKIEFKIDKSYASHVYFEVTPMFSTELFDKAFVMPYFQSLSEVSADA